MLKTWKLRIASAALVGVAVTAGCLDFNDARAKCDSPDGRCAQGAAPPDGGTDGGTDAGCIITNPMDTLGDNQDTNCDGFDGVATSALFVDPVNGSDASGVAGTPETPLRTLGEALQRIRSGTVKDKAAIVLAQGTYNEDGLVLDKAVSLYGGFGGRSNWFRQAGLVTQLNGGTVGFTVNGLPDSGIVLEQLTIASADATGAGSPSIALYVLGSSGVQLRQDILLAGRGATGKAGDGGTPGTDAPDGGAGGNGDDVTQGTPGPGANFSCGGRDVSGGGGKKGSSETAGLQGVVGNPQPQADGGGLGGVGGNVGNPSTPDTNNFQNCIGGPGGSGDAGVPGDAGIAGQAGRGEGVIQDGGWFTNQTGSNGTAGTAGAGGGGGGSGGGCPVLGTDVTKQTAAGAGSGGGGAGGCGGLGGEGGGGGGASIALLLSDSNVTLSDVTLKTQGGGSGGPGGAGGRGGQGGGGGVGGKNDAPHTYSYFNVSAGANVSYTTRGGSGGSGGNGGNGGAGGPGGGGGGGPSVGIWCGPNAGYTSSQPITDERLGNGGKGGDSAGNPGADGQKLPTMDCPDAGL